MLEKTIGRYLLWAGFFVVGILACTVIWNWKMFSVTLAFTGLLAVALTTIADSARERDNSQKATLDIVHQPNRKIPRLRALLKGGISCLFSG